jgi:hypothetical protein
MGFKKLDGKAAVVGFAESRPTFRDMCEVRVTDRWGAQLDMCEVRVTDWWGAQHLLEAMAAPWIYSIWGLSVQPMDLKV